MREGSSGNNNGTNLDGYDVGLGQSTLDEDRYNAAFQQH